MAKTVHPGRLAPLLALLLLATTWHARGAEPWVVPEEESARDNPQASSPEVLEQARKVWEARCLPCHGPKGKGDGAVARAMGINAADLSDPTRTDGMTDGEIFYKISTGRDPMPAFASKVQEEDRWMLVHLVREFSRGEGGGEGSPDAAR